MLSRTVRSVLIVSGVAVAMPALAQDPMDEPARVPVAASDPRVVRPAAPTPPAHWSQRGLRDLLAAIDASAAEGLRPSDYLRDELAALVAETAQGPLADAVAEAAARALAHDYADGRVSDRARFDWHIDHSPAALATLNVDLDRAVADGRLGIYFVSLLPHDPRYVALREALAGSGDPRRSAAIRASMERWRWMPRELGQNYVMVNVPAYRLTLFDGDGAVATHDVVVGARKTPTPMISAYANSIVVNPWWTLPPSVLAEGKRYSSARGYVYTSVNGRPVVRQRPGPQNALGRLKIDMPNDYAIYLHDTPAKAAFAKVDRALSHGCIRVKDIDRLADEIDGTQQVASALDTRTTQTLQLQKSLPVYIVYFTAAQDADGRVVALDDPYDRDAALTAALDGGSRPAVELASAAL